MQHFSVDRVTQRIGFHIIPEPDMGANSTGNLMSLPRGGQFIRIKEILCIIEFQCRPDRRIGPRDSTARIVAPI